MSCWCPGLLDDPAWIVAPSLCSYNLGGDPGPPHLWTPVVTWINSVDALLRPSLLPNE